MHTMDNRKKFDSVRMACASLVLVVAAVACGGSGDPEARRFASVHSPQSFLDVVEGNALAVVGSVVATNPKLTKQYSQPDPERANVRDEGGFAIQEIKIAVDEVIASRPGTKRPEPGSTVRARFWVFNPDVNMTDVGAKTDELKHKGFKNGDTGIFLIMFGPRRSTPAKPTPEHLNYLNQFEVTAFAAGEGPTLTIAGVYGPLVGTTISAAEARDVATKGLAEPLPGAVSASD